MIKILAIRIANDPIHPSLLPTPINDRLQNTFTKVKKENPQLGSNADHNSTTVWQYMLIDWLLLETTDIYVCAIDTVASS